MAGCLLAGTSSIRWNLRPSPRWRIIWLRLLPRPGRFTGWAMPIWISPGSGRWPTPGKRPSAPSIRSGSDAALATTPLRPFHACSMTGWSGIGHLVRSDPSGQSSRSLGADQWSLGGNRACCSAPHPCGILEGRLHVATFPGMESRAGLVARQFRFLGWRARRGQDRCAWFCTHKLAWNATPSPIVCSVGVDAMARNYSA